MTTSSTSSTVQAWELGAHLRERREQLGLTAASVGKTTGIGGSNLSAIEAGKRRLTAAKLSDLATLYGLPADEQAELDTVRVQADERGWWHDYSNLYSEEFLRFLGLEAGAERVREYAPDIVPGLLQTSDYGRAMIRAGSPYIKPVDVGPRLETRLARQARLDGPSPLQLDVVLGEAALRQQVGGTAVLRRQLEHLMETMENRAAHVRVRVVPFAAGAHPLIGAALTMLSFPSPRLPDLVWQETAVSGGLVDKRQVILESTASFTETFDRAPDETASLEIIKQIHKEMEHS
jgi:transcriptional regulator with XRE-family HTH domain